ncbi:hypothetical protein PQX77_008497 [Marasmius sp. AFHP31]|nr:hypothetical protein PQX77_008497 [Marasmius sp. AFHP31]
MSSTEPSFRKRARRSGKSTFSQAQLDLVSDSAQGFADTLSSGIQDIAALLPLLGTDQCEVHVGSALDVGFLYAAATPLSIFGSLGIVKASFATLLATISRPFHGARWLDDAGFSTPGSVSSLVTIVKGTAEYGAEASFRDLLVDKHVGDPELVSSIEWAGWKTLFAERVSDDTYTQLPEISIAAQTPFAPVLTWNLMLILSSAMGSLISLTPYLYLISPQWDDPLAWLFPAFRALGSFLCVVFVQLALQLRIRHIVRSRLLLMKYHKRNPHHDPFKFNGYLEDEIGACYPTTYARTHLFGLRTRIIIPDEEKLPVQRVNEDEAALVFGFDWLLLIYQVLIAVGMAMTVAGYIGCFNLVGKSGASHGPYVWVGLETFLSLVRTSLWGSNPSWDESAGLKLSLQLTAKEIPLPSVDEDDGNPKSPDQNALVPYFPLITTPTQIPFIENLTHTPSFEGIAFVAHPESDFLSTATSYTGPLDRFKADDISSLLYAIVGLGGEKALVTVVVFAHSRASWCLIFNKEFSWAVSSTYQVLPKTTTLLVTLGSVIKEDSLALSREVYDTVRSHSRSIAAQFFGPPQPTLVLKWDLSPEVTQSDSPVGDQKMVGTLTPHDEAYISTMQRWKRKSRFMLDRIESFRQYVDSVRSDETVAARVMHRLYLYLLETAILEMELCRKDHEFASARMVSDVSLSRRLAPEWIHAMNTRMKHEKQAIDSLWPGREWGMLSPVWRELQSGLELLRESGDVIKLNWVLAHIRTLQEPLEQVQAPIASFDIAMGNRSMNWIWARCSGAWATSETPANREAYELDFHLTLLRLKTLLTRGYDAATGSGSLADPARFFQPYLALDEFSEYHVKGIQKSNALCTLQLRPQSPDDPHARECLGRLASLPDSIGQLTSLHVTEVAPYPELPKILHDILDKHHNIISIACPHFSDNDEIEELQRHISENRKAWNMRAESHRIDFQYLVGFEPEDPFMTDELDSNFVTVLLGMRERNFIDESPAPQKTMTADGQDILFHDGRMECLVLFYAPSPGRVTIELNCAAQQPESTQTYSADGVEVVGRYKADTEDGWSPILAESRQSGDEGHLQLALDVAKGGSYEVRIRLSKSFDPDDFLHGDVVRLRGLPLVKFEERRQL